MGLLCAKWDCSGFGSGMRRWWMENHPAPTVCQKQGTLRDRAPAYGALLHPSDSYTTPGGCGNPVSGIAQTHISDQLYLSHHTTVPPVGSGQLLLGQGHACSHCQNDLPLNFYLLPLVPFPSQLPLSQPFFFPLSLSLFSLLFSFLATKAPTNNSQLSGAPNKA